MVLLPSVPSGYEWVQQDWTGTVPTDTFFVRDGSVMWVLTLVPNHPSWSVYGEEGSRPR